MNHVVPNEQAQLPQSSRSTPGALQAPGYKARKTAKPKPQGTEGLLVQALQPLPPVVIDKDRGEPGRGRVIVFVIRELTPTMNVLKRMHWARYARARKRIAMEVFLAIRGQAPDAPITRCRVDVVRYGRRLLDDDNLPSCAKILLDVLQPFDKKRCPSGLGVIAGDDPERCEVRVTQQRVGREDVRMHIRIEELQ